MKADWSPMFLFNLFFGVSWSLRIKVLDVPEVAQAGHHVHLTCDYDLERESLYQVKWYKGTHEFYRFSPYEEKKTKLFLVENLNVDVSSSDERTVVLRDLHIDMTGNYSCEVTTEGTFETVKESAKMTVIALPAGGPHIQGYLRQVEVGEFVTLNCTSLKSKPAANLTFFINDQNASEMRQIDPKHVLIVNEEDRPQTESSFLSMTFKVRLQHVREARIRIRCEASILKMYKRERSVDLYVKTYPAESLATPENQHQSGQASASQPRRPFTVDRLLLLHLLLQTSHRLFT